MKNKKYFVSLFFILIFIGGMSAYHFSNKHLEKMVGQMIMTGFHGDGMGDPSRSFRFIRRIFRSRFCQFLYSLLPTRWSMWFGLSWAKKSMEDHRLNGGDRYLGEDKEFQVIYAK